MATGADEPVAPPPAADPSPSPSPAPASTFDTSAEPPKKPIHSLVIDTGPIIKNEPTVSTLLAQAEELYTIPSVISEIRDEATRNRLQTSLLPFLKIRSPRPEAINFVTQFARRTGDLEVLSKPDIHLIALTYELELERNGSDWRLRKTPTQGRLNGAPPGREEEEGKKEEETQNAPAVGGVSEGATVPAEPDVTYTEEVRPVESLEEEVQNLEINAEAAEVAPSSEVEPPEIAEADASGEEDDDDDGWITPSNLKQHQAKDHGKSPAQPIQRMLQAALLTSDNAMTNVSLRINLNCVNTNFSQVFRLKTWVLRCHGCFTVTRKMSAQFCPNCGQATLTRVSCSTDSSGKFEIYLKRNFQHNKRGNVYSIPKPVHGAAHGRQPTSGGAGGGKGGWGRDLILAEDQKEYTRKVESDRRQRYRDLMDEDYLPGILSGDRSGGHGRIKVGAGRNVNSKKRN